MVSGTMALASGMRFWVDRPLFYSPPFFLLRHDRENLEAAFFSHGEGDAKATLLHFCHGLVVCYNQQCVRGDEPQREGQRRRPAATGTTEREMKID